MTRDSSLVSSNNNKSTDLVIYVPISMRKKHAAGNTTTLSSKSRPPKNDKSLNNKGTSYSMHTNYHKSLNSQYKRQQSKSDSSNDSSSNVKQWSRRQQLVRASSEASDSSSSSEKWQRGESVQDAKSGIAITRLEKTTRHRHYRIQERKLERARSTSTQESEERKSATTDTSKSQQESQGKSMTQEQAESPTMASRSHKNPQKQQRGMAPKKEQQLELRNSKSIDKECENEPEQAMSTIAMDDSKIKQDPSAKSPSLDRIASTVSSESEKSRNKTERPLPVIDLGQLLGYSNSRLQSINVTDNGNKEPSIQSPSLDRIASTVSSETQKRQNENRRMKPKKEPLPVIDFGQLCGYSNAPLKSADNDIKEQTNPPKSHSSTAPRMEQEEEKREKVELERTKSAGKMGSQESEQKQGVPKKDQLVKRSYTATTLLSLKPKEAPSNGSHAKLAVSPSNTYPRAAPVLIHTQPIRVSPSTTNFYAGLSKEQVSSQSAKSLDRTASTVSSKSQKSQNKNKRHKKSKQAKLAGKSDAKESRQKQGVSKNGQLVKKSHTANTPSPKPSDGSHAKLAVLPSVTPRLVLTYPSKVSPPMTTGLYNGQLKFRIAPKHVMSMDCEMVGVGVDGKRSILARVSLVDWSGNVLLDTFVAPTEHVTDYRTSISGIRPLHLVSFQAMDFLSCRMLVYNWLKAKPILVGHGLKSDLDALKLTHPWYLIRDSTTYLPFTEPCSQRGVRPKRLRDLAREELGISIQQDGTEHCSVIDAQTAMELYKRNQTAWDLYVEDHLNVNAFKAPQGGAALHSSFHTKHHSK